MPADPLLLASITDVTVSARDHCVVSGSHGGLYPAAVASQGELRCVVFNDAGIGLDQAGVAGVLALADTGMAAAAVDCHSALIGSARDMLDRGRISVANDTARTLGVQRGQSVAQALEFLRAAPAPHGRLPVPLEARRRVQLDGSGLHVLLVDSASLVRPEDGGRIIISGSHGALVGGDPERALKARARIAAFNDAGFEDRDMVNSRLPALETRGVAAVLVACSSARIGDAFSTLDTGVISHVNDLAAHSGARTGVRLKDWLESLRPRVSI